MSRIVRILAPLVMIIVGAACSGGSPATTDDTEPDTAANVSSIAAAADATEETTPEPVVVETTPEATAQVVAQAPTATTAPSGEPALPVNENGVQIVAVVNGEQITQTEFDTHFTRTRSAGDVTSASYDALAAATLDTLIEQVLISQAADEMNIAVSEEEVEAEYQQTRGLAPDAASWESWLAENGFDESEFRASLRDALLTEKLRDEVVQSADTEVAQIRARHILVNTIDDAQAVLDRLAAGEDFETLAAALSNDVTTREQGGDLGWFIREDLLTPELADVAFALQPGEIGGPVQTMLGYHVIQTMEREQRPVTDAERPVVAVSQFNEWLDVLRDNAEIERYIDY